MGVFSVSYASTWVGSQRDQADYQVGADARVTLRRSPDALPDWAERSAIASVPGVAGALAIARDSATFTRSSGTGEVFALDMTAAKAVLGSTTGANEVDATARALLEARQASAGVALGGEPRRLRLNVTNELRSAIWDFNDQTGEGIQRPVSPESLPDQFWITPTVTLRDAAGLFHVFHGERAPLVTGSQLLDVAIVPSSAGAMTAVETLGGGLDGPVELAGIDLAIEEPFGAVSFGRLVIDAVATSETSDGAAWAAVEPGNAGDWAVHGPSASGFGPLPTVTLGDAPRGAGPAHLAIDATELWSDNGGKAPVLSVIRSSIVAAAARAMPVVGNRAFLAAVGASPGDEVTVQLGTATRRLRIVGVVDVFPTTDPDKPTAIVDLASLSLLRFAGSHAYQGVDQWWLQLTDPAATPRANGVFAGAGIVSRVETRERLTTEPLAVAMIGGLSLGFVVAGLFAVIGLAVSASVSARQRRSEFALLRALGLSPGQLSGWLWLENASVVVVAVAAGTALGLLIGWVVLPFVTVNSTGGTPFPPVVVEVPWASVLTLTAVSAAALVLTLVFLVRSIRRAGIGSVLRMGEE
jgi:hypothetical protein